MSKVNSGKFVSTVLVNGDFSRIKPGQWVRLESGSRGQYLGTTAAGVTVVRYQSGAFGAKRDTKGNALLREYARINGSK